MLLLCVCQTKSDKQLKISFSFIPMNRRRNIIASRFGLSVLLWSRYNFKPICFLFKANSWELMNIVLLYREIFSEILSTPRHHDIFSASATYTLAGVKTWKTIFPFAACPLTFVIYQLVKVLIIFHPKLIILSDKGWNKLDLYSCLLFRAVLAWREVN